MQYDLCDPDIRCNADKSGAEVFEVSTKRRSVRVLTYSRERAEELAREYTPERQVDEGAYLF
jgi:hypothetical protein